MVAHFTNKRFKNVREFYFNDLSDLYHQLIDRCLINTLDYDPVDRARIEKAGFDFVKFNNSYISEYDSNDTDWFEFLNRYNLPDLTDLEMYEVIRDSIDRNTYDFTFYYFETDQEVKFDDQGKIVPRIKVVD